MGSHHGVYSELEVVPSSRPFCGVFEHDLCLSMILILEIIATGQPDSERLSSMLSASIAGSANVCAARPTATSTQEVYRRQSSAHRAPLLLFIQRFLRNYRMARLKEREAGSGADKRGTRDGSNRGLGSSGNVSPRSSCSWCYCCTNIQELDG